MKKTGDKKFRRLVPVICRMVLGLTLVFSGFVKTVDPWGAALKIGEYLNVYGAGAVADGISLALAILLCAAELTLGLLLVFNVKMRLTSLVAVVVMGAFGVVTLLSATVLPVEDCGCFGDALHMSPLMSLAKNVVLLILAVAVWTDARRSAAAIRPVLGREWVAGGVFFALSAGVGLFCLLHLPLIDFLPFRKGVDLYQAKYIEEDDRDISLMQFAVFNSGGDATHDILSDGGRVYLLCAAKLSDIGPRCEERFENVVERAAAEGAGVMLVTSSPISADETVVFGSSAPVTVYNADATTMITMLRARIGMVVIDGGTIVDKKNCCDI